jgi:putative FmdB family regulatory protein
MPIYVYECDTCGDVYEVEQRIVEDALTECRCGKGKIKRVMQPVGVAFKGSGFYVNDASGAAPPPVSTPKSDPVPDAKPAEVAKPETAKPEPKKSE